MHPAPGARECIQRPGRANASSARCARQRPGHATAPDARDSARGTRQRPGRATAPDARDSARGTRQRPGRANASSARGARMHPAPEAHDKPTPLFFTLMAAWALHECVHCAAVRQLLAGLQEPAVGSDPLERLLDACRQLACRASMSSEHVGCADGKKLGVGEDKHVAEGHDLCL
jgi:hypothetical protein